MAGMKGENGVKDSVTKAKPKEKKQKSGAASSTKLVGATAVAMALAAVALGRLFGGDLTAEALAAELRVLIGGVGTAMLPYNGAAVAALPRDAPAWPRDFGVLCSFVLILFTLNWGVRLLLVDPIVRAVLGVKGGKLLKFSQSVMEAIFYGCFSYIGLMVTPSQEWSWPSANWWVGFDDGGHEIMRSDLRCFYLLYIARYFQAGISVLLETKRKDFLEMMIHHVATVLVCTISYVYGWNRVGVVVMTLLDPADVPLHLAKLCKYTGEATKRSIWQFFADRLFELFAVVFLVTRIICYGYVCWSAHGEAASLFKKSPASWTCNALLDILLCLQVYWFFLILRVAAKLLRGQNVEDPRSDDESED
eukprot:TRINITY_DN13949_c0_g2_i1.p1 TRINITY_DN13949_c0_g2~~TRINITY_DN13949_c0_g2_i1.p1  ORF type:complete len:384 (-),score=78.98 TRINITY_DN13949_c0_g2_i1:123-1211(-)